MTDRVNVLDKGYVRLEQTMGNDLTAVNAAKASFEKRSDTFGDREAKLLGFLQREEHTSVFRHSALTFECYAPLMVARQWFKYIVASSHTEDQQGWNESSRRYITEEPTFYTPGSSEWRSAPDNKKQGSGLPIAQWEGVKWTDNLEHFIDQGVAYYEDAMAAGICAEQARLFLPAYGMYVRWWWTTSLGALTHFLFQRLEHDAQKEIQLYAQAVRYLTAKDFPVTMESVLDKA